MSKSRSKRNGDYTASEIDYRGKTLLEKVALYANKITNQEEVNYKVSTDKTNVVEESNENTVEMAGIEPASECCPPSESLERGSCSCQDNCDRDACGCEEECCPPCPPCPPECPTRGISLANVMQSIKDIKK